MADLSIADQIQQYNNCLIFYKGRPHKVKQIGAEVKLLDLLTQKTKLVQFKLDDFTSPMTRMGFVNIDETAIYLARRPVRMMLVGINAGNCQAFRCEGAYYPNDIVSTTNKVLELDSVEVGNMLLGHYPTLAKARERAGTFEGCMAFDKQFAVDFVDNIYYKSKKVGKFTKGAIKWNAGFEYLSLLLNNEYEKAARTFGQKAA